MKLPRELAVLPDEAVVQWGWVRRKLEAGEPDEEERMIALVVEHCTRNLAPCPSGDIPPDRRDSTESPSTIDAR